MADCPKCHEKLPLFFRSRHECRPRLATRYGASYGGVPLSPSRSDSTGPAPAGPLLMSGYYASLYAPTPDPSPSWSGGGGESGGAGASGSWSSDSCSSSDSGSSYDSGSSSDSGSCSSSD